MSEQQEATRAASTRRDTAAREVMTNEGLLPGQGELEPDVEAIHRQLYRESRDPEEGREPAPWWLWATIALAIFWGGWYLGRNGGTYFSTRTQEEFPALRQGQYVAEQEAEQAASAVQDPVQAGEVIYKARCQSCHQANGLGLANVFPPLVGAEWVLGPPETTVRILLHGLQGPVDVAGANYKGVMPPWRDSLTDSEIAAVITFIRQWDENDAPAVDQDLVAMLREEHADRKESWTAEELKALETAGSLLEQQRAGTLDGAVVAGLVVAAPTR